MQKRLSRTLDLYFVSYKDEYNVVHVCFLAEHVELASLENEIQNRWFTSEMPTGHFFPAWPVGQARPNIMWTDQARPKFQNPAWPDGLAWWPVRRLAALIAINLE